MGAEREATRLSAAPTKALADASVSDLREHLRELLALAETSDKPRPTNILKGSHPMPGQEWAIDAYMPKKLFDSYKRERSGWLVRAVDDAADSDCVFISTPDAMDAEDFMAVPTTTARQLAMAILAACDRADAVAAGVSSLDNWRNRKTPPTEGDQVT